MEANNLTASQQPQGLPEAAVRPVLDLIITDQQQLSERGLLQ